MKKMNLLLIAFLFIAIAGSAQVELVKDVRPGEGFGVTGVGFALLNDYLLFEGGTNETGNELWISDGTEAGTQLLADIFEGTSGSYVNNFTMYKNELYFYAKDASHGAELWKTDGTPGGTQMLKDILVGSWGSDPSDLVVYGDYLYFIANDGLHAGEIWRTDGTADGTEQVTDIQDGSGTSNVSRLTLAGDKFFFVYQQAGFGMELWVSDGTQVGTMMVKDIRPGSAGSDIRNLRAIGDKVYFAATVTSISNWEPWVSDGTEAGTFQLKEIADGETSSNPQAFTAFNGEVLFSANNSSQLWKTDGTPGGTVLLKNIRLSPFADVNPNFIQYGDKMYFPACECGNTGLDYELWNTDGTTDGTQLFMEISPGFLGSDPENFISFDNQILFGANDNGSNGKELWISDGTVAGTKLFADIYPGNFSSEPSSLTVSNDSTWLYLNGRGPLVGFELFRVKLDLGTAVPQLPAFIHTIKVFPNLTTGLVNVELSEILDQPLQLHLITLTGKVIQQTPIEHSTQLDLSAFTNGIYLLRFDYDGQSWTQKVIVSK